MNRGASYGNSPLLYIVGAGGFGREVAWLAAETRPEHELCFVVDGPEFMVDEVDGLPVALMASLKPRSGSGFVVAIGDPGKRQLLAEKMARIGHSEMSLVHPRTNLSSRISLGNGVVIAAGNILTTGIRIGDHVHVNLACTIGHDVFIGDFTTLSPGVHVSGNVHIGRGVFVGTGAVIVNGAAGNPLMIGDGAVIAAGACVTRHVEAGAMVAGIPAIRKR